MGRCVAEHKRDHLACVDGELADRLQVLAAQRRRGTQHHSIGPADGGKAAFRQAFNPGHHGAIVKAQDELGAHGDTPAQPADQAHKLGKPAARAHEIDELDRALRRLERGCENQRAVEIAPFDTGSRPDRAD